MKKILFFFVLMLIANFLFAQMPEACNNCLQKLIESSTHYKKRFGNKDIFSDKRWIADASSDGYNLTLTIYHENPQVEVNNRIVTYELNGITKKLSVKDTFSKYNSTDVQYNKKLLMNVYKYCRKNKLFIKNV